MQQGLVSATNEDRLMSSMPFVPPDQRLSSPPYLTNGGDYLGLYSIFSPKKAISPNSLTPIPNSGSVSLTPSSVSFDEEDPTATDNRLFLAGLSLQYREIAERYEICLSHLQDTAREAEALRQENAQLHIANGELTKRLSLLSEKQQQNGRQIPSSAAMSIVEEFRKLCIRNSPAAAEASPTSVLGFEEKRVPLPKSISIRSSGYLKLNSSESGSNRNARIRISSPIPVGSQRAYVGGGSKKGSPEEAALELEVYNQGMFKTEICNKWQEDGECPYGEHCQFAHGISELRPVIRHPRYKTEVCRMVLSGETCPYGHRCHFRHALSPRDHHRFLQRPTI